MSVEVDPQTLQQIEHAYQIKEIMLRTNLAKQAELQQEEGRIRCEMQRLDNERFKRMTNRELVPEHD